MLREERWGVKAAEVGRVGAKSSRTPAHSALVLLLSSKRQRGDVRQLSGSSVGGGSSFDIATVVANTTTTNPFAKRLSLEIQYEKNIHDEES